MSTTVDERVVEMRFDNRDFEKNVSTSMSTLDKLKQKLNLTGASKNLDELNRAAKRVDFNPLSNSLDNVVTRFSHAQMTLQHQIDRYMDRLVMMGERAVKALTIDPIKTGFQEYETQMNSVQTILANTQSKGSTLDDVNKALDELNTYADKTIYNFTEMTRNIGTFTAAGIELDTSVNAIQGIANLAAISGSTSQQASTAMYQLSQALASGTVKLMDWNSVVNAGMGGEVFQNALKETSKLLGTGAEAAIKAKGSFRESLQTGWLTAEVLTETLKKFTTTGANEYVAEYIGESPEFVQAALDKADAMAEEAKMRGEEVDAIEEASKALAEHSGKSKDEIKSILGMARNAEDAATKVKTFTQLWDVLKESAQSGWSQTWKLIIGDFQEAKDLLSPLADVLTGFIGKMSDARNWIVQGVVDFTTPWTNIMKKLEGAGLLKTVQKVTDSVMDAAKKIEYYQDIVNKVWRGDYKNSDTGRYGLLDADGYNHKVVQSLVNKGYQYELTIEDIEEAEKKFGVTIGETAKTTEEMGNVIANLSDEQLRNAGLTEEEIRLYRDLEKYAKESGKSIDELAKEMSENDGRTLLIDSFKNIGNSIIAIFKAIGQAWSDVFDPVSIVGIYHAIKGFNEWTKSLKLVDERTGELNETGQKIKRTLAGVFAIVDVLTTILGGGFKIAFKIVSAILEYFNLDLLSFTAMIGDALVAFSDWFDSIFDISGAVKWLIDMVKKAIPVVKGWIESFSKLPFVQKVINGIKEAFVGLKSINLRSIGQWLVEGFQGGFAEGIKNMLTAVFEFGKKILSTIKEVLGIHSPSTEFFDIATWCIKGFVNGLIAGIKYIGTGIVNIGKAIIDAFRDSGVVDGIKNIFGKIKDVLSKIDFGKILAAVPIGLAILLVKKIYDFASSFGKVMNSIDDILGGVADVLTGFSKVLKGIAFKTYTEGIKELAIAMLIMAGSVALLTLLDTDKLYDSVAIILVLAVILGALAFAMGQMSKASASFKWKEGFNISGLTSSLASIGLAILMLAASIKLIGSMKPEVLKQGLLGMAAIIAGLVVVMAAFKGLGDNKSAENIHKVGKLIFKLSLSMLLLVAFCKIVSKLDGSEMGKAALFAAGFTIFVKSLCNSAHGHGKYIDKVGKMIFKLSLSMLLLVAFCKLAGKLTLGEMGKAALFAAGFAVFVGILVGVTKIDNGKQLAKLGGTLLSVTLAMMLMIGVCKLVGKLETRDIIAGALFMVGFIAFAWLLTKVTTITNEQKSARIAGAILAMAIAVAALAVVAVLMSMMTTEGLIKGVSAVVALCVGMAIMVAAAKNVSGDAMKSLIMLVAAVAIMAIIVGVFANMDAKSLLTATGSLALLLGMFTVLLKVNKGLGSTNGLIKNIAPMLGVVAVLGLFLAGLAYIANRTDGAKLLATTISLSILMVAMIGCMKLLNTISTSVGGALKGALALTSLAVPMLAFIFVLSKMNNLETATENIRALTILMIAMTIVLGALTVIGAFIGPALFGVGALLALAIPTLAFIGLVVLMNNVSNAQANIDLILKLMGSLTSMLVQLALVGPLALIGVVAILALEIAIVAFGALALAIGALMTAFPTLEDFLNKGIPMLVQLAGGLGEAISAFMSGLTSNLPTIGQNLTDFMNNSQGFIDGCKNIDESAVIGAGCLAGAIIAISAANLIAGITQLLPFVGSLSDLGTDLSQFMLNAMPFIMGLKLIDESAVTAAGSLAGMILALTAAELIQGIASWLGIDMDLETFGEQLEDFGESIIKFSNALVANGGIDEGVIGAAARAGELMATLQDKIIPTNGVITWFTGDKDFNTFGEQLEDFGESIVEFSNTLVANGGIDEGVIGAAARAGDLMTTLQDKIIPTNGVITWFTGDKDFDVFGEQLEDFGESIVNFSNALVENGGIDEGVIGAAARAGELMATLQDKIIPTNGVITWFTGDKDFTKFGEQLEDFGESLVDFSDEVAGNIDEDAIKAASNAGTMMTTLQASIPEDKWLDGKMSLDDFGKTIVKFGEKMIEFSETCADLKSDKIEVAATIASKLNGMLANFASSKTDALSYFDDNDLTGFIDGLINVQLKANGLNAEALNTFIDTANDFASSISNFATIDTTGVTTFKNVIDELKTIDVSGLESFDVDVSGLENVASTIVVTISNGMSTRADTIKNTLLSIMDLAANSLSVKNEVYQAKASDLLGNMVLGFNSKKEAISTSVKSIVSDIAAAISNGGKSFHDAGANLIDDIIATFGSAASKMETVGGNLMKSIVNGMNTNKGSLKTTVTGIANDMDSVLKSKNKLFQQSGTEIIKSLMNGIKSQTAGLLSSLKTAITSAASSLTSQYTNFYSAGSYLADGFANGISANSYKAAAQAAAMAEAAKQAAEEALGIKSPSRVFYGIGDYTGQGFVNALADYAVKSYKAGSEMANSAREGLTNAISKATDVLSGKTDMQPTIRPVVDLSGVESGTSAINSMLNMGSRIGISANVGAVSSMMSRRNQNGANSDIVAAIDRLDKHLDNVGNTSYSVNGVTYDDGSNIKNAVETIVRAARIERRV